MCTIIVTTKLPAEACTLCLTADQDFNGADLERFLAAGGEIYNNGYRVWVSGPVALSLEAFANLTGRNIPAGSRAIAGMVTNEPVPASASDPTAFAQPSLWECLTAREQEIALLLGRGDTNREISSALNISIKTVDTHRGHVLKKLACRNNVALARYLLRESKVSL